MFQELGRGDDKSNIAGGFGPTLSGVELLKHNSHTLEPKESMEKAKQEQNKIGAKIQQYKSN